LTFARLKIHLNILVYQPTMLDAGSKKTNACRARFVFDELPLFI